MLEVFKIIFLSMVSISLLVLSIGLFLMIYQELVDSGLIKPFKRKDDE